ncbi:glutathione S-transferase N-terminal domain-containing protein [Stigmatella aurantiaca]|uniref:Glutathione S-transferase n=1 Tax=Stigmatella aurantiaca (strain DW4/3-1) TaxID=378806 RepID=Q09AQ7_STIAD|nr:glutathione S-transferase N-terminal domain-containing protein [Stigmatella aurantiaca]ADO74862.1 Glutathione S-transferase domain protein [Stigmatella aurantiaca DW4/3-1]EAU68778.1 glutathione S-transferase [Stigmatella aurantiaca DW4/3-1]
MIDLYTFSTPNGQKASIALEELGLPYTVKVINITQGEQFHPEFLAINPNNKIPAIVDHSVPGGLKLFESGAILLYLAEKTGRLLPTDLAGKAEVTQWLMFQMGGVGPMLGQLGFFNRFSPTKIPLAIERYRNESSRLLGVLDRHLSSRDYVAREYSVADIALYPWLVGARNAYPELFRALRGVPQWLERVGARPAVQRGMKIPNLAR